MMAIAKVDRIIRLVTNPFLTIPSNIALFDFISRPLVAWCINCTMKWAAGTLRPS